DGVIVDLDLKSGYHRLPCRVVWIERRFVCGAPFELVRREFERRTWEANEHSTVMPRGVEDLELEAQRKVPKRLRRVIEQSQSAIAVTDHFAIDMQHATADGTSETPSRKARGGAIEERTEPGFGLRIYDGVGAGKHSRI